MSYASFPTDTKTVPPATPAENTTTSKKVTRVPDKRRRMGPGSFVWGRLLGTGAFADVFEVTHKASGKKYAAKKVSKMHIVRNVS